MVRLKFIEQKRLILSKKSLDRSGNEEVGKADLLLNFDVVSDIGTYPGAKVVFRKLFGLRHSDGLEFFSRHKRFKVSIESKKF